MKGATTINLDQQSQEIEAMNMLFYHSATSQRLFIPIVAAQRLFRYPYINATPKYFRNL